MTYTTPVFNQEIRRKLRQLLDEDPKATNAELGRKLGVNRSAISRELGRKGGRYFYDPDAISYATKTDLMSRYASPLLPKSQIDFLEKLEAFNGQSRAIQHSYKINDTVRRLIKEYLDIRSIVRFGDFCLAVGVSCNSVRREIDKHGGMKNYQPVYLSDKEEELNIKPINTFSHSSNLHEEIEALKMHINILYEQLEKLRGKND